jgi:hypothetical protein
MSDKLLTGYKKEDDIRLMTGCLFPEADANLLAHFPNDQRALDQLREVLYQPEEKPFEVKLIVFYRQYNTVLVYPIFANYL